MKNYVLISLTFGALGLGACTVGPDYKDPPVTPPQDFVAGEVLEALNAGKDEDLPAGANWWEGFNDPILNELIETGLEENFEIAAAMARVKAARARIGLADSADDLFIGSDAGADIQERRELEPESDSQTTTFYSAGLGLGLPLDIFGRTRRDTQRARAELQAATEELRGIVLFVSSDIADEYLSLRGNQRQLELLRESVDLQEQTLSIVRTRYESGLSPELDVQRATSSVESLRAQIPPLEENLQNSRNELATLSGKFPGAYKELLTPAQDIPLYSARIPDALPLDVLNARPDIAQSEADLKAAIAAIGVAEAEFYPSFDLAANLTFGRTGVSSMNPTEVLIGSLSAIIEQVITDGGARSANREIAEAQAEEALADYELALRNAVQEVEASLNAIRASAARQDSLEKAVQASERSFSQAQTLYRQGLISFLDVVDAQQDLASDEQALASERTDYAREIATLFDVLGAEIKTEPSSSR